jgi:multicomponent Na+:H+ antiporter subunit E
LGIEKKTDSGQVSPHRPGRHNLTGNGIKGKRLAPFLFTFVISMLTWLILSGQYDAFHIALGIISSAIVAYFSGDLLFRGRISKAFFRQSFRFLLYIPWLLYQIWIANLNILLIVFRPKLMNRIDPRIIRFNSKLSGQMPLFIFGNSITLTPGTITIFVNVFGTYTVHAIDEKSAKALPGEMETRIAKIFSN